MRRLITQTAVPAIALGGLTACLGLTERKFEKKVIKAQCEQYQDCSPTEFDAEFDSIKDCEDAVASESASALAFYDDCDYVRDEAKDCLKAIEGLPCEAVDADYVDFYNSCFNVWVCEGTSSGSGTQTPTTPGTR